MKSLELRGKILINKNMFLLLVSFLIIGSFLIASTSGSGTGAFDSIISFLEKLIVDSKSIFLTGGVLVVMYGAFRFITDPNMGAIITMLIGVVLVLGIIFGANAIVSGVGGATINLQDLGGI